MIRDGTIVTTGRSRDGSVIGTMAADDDAPPPKRVWNLASHNAETGGTNILSSLIPGRRFPYPKSLYAVEDVLRFFVADKPNAVILDFFSGSGTTAHAAMRLNRQDGGHRQCICVTNNEVAASEQSGLRAQGLRPGDPDWERLGICDYITKPRVEAAITGKAPSGQPIQGEYKFTDEFPLADGFEENAEFFTLTYESLVAVNHNLAFLRVAPLLWMRAGSEGRRIDILPNRGWDVAETYGLLADLDQATAFCKAVRTARGIRIAYIVTNDDRRFQAVSRRLPASVEPIRLYKSYLSNFQFVNGEGLMKFTLKDYQDEAVHDVLSNLRKARKRWHEDGDKHAFSLTATTGAGKTVMAAAAFEALFYGDDDFDFHADLGAVVIWFSDDPSLNEQTRFRLMEASDRLTFTNLVVVQNTFNRDKFEAGKVYFLNTQKLGKKSLLVRGHDPDEEYARRGIPCHCRGRTCAHTQFGTRYKTRLRTLRSLSIWCSMRHIEVWVTRRGRHRRISPPSSNGSSMAQVQCLQFLSSGVSQQPLKSSMLQWQARKGEASFLTSSWTRPKCRVRAFEGYNHLGYSRQGWTLRYRARAARHG